MNYKEYENQKTFVVEKFTGLLSTYPTTTEKIVYTTESKTEAQERADELHHKFLTEEQRIDGKVLNHFRVSVNTLTEQGKNLYKTSHPDNFTTVNLVQKNGFEGRGDMEDDWDETEEQKSKNTAEEKQHIERLKITGEYGRLYDMEISMQNDSYFDSSPTEPNHTSYRMEIVDFSKPVEIIPHVDSPEHIAAWKDYIAPNPYDK